MTTNSNYVENSYTNGTNGVVTQGPYASQTWRFHKPPQVGGTSLEWLTLVIGREEMVLQLKMP